MYQVVIADSAYYTTGKSKYSLDWNQEGFNVVCIAKTASEAMSFISNEEVDLLFTDLSFPDAEGIDLIRYVRTHCPYVRIIVVSDHTDFSYVKSSYELEVFDYVVRNRLNPAMLKDILKRFKESENRIHALHTLSIFENADEYVAKRKQIINVLTRQSEDPGLKNMLIIAVRVFNYQLLKQIHSPDDLNILIQNIITTAVQVIRDPLPVIFPDNSGNIIICMDFDPSMPETAIMNSINTYVRRINFLVKKFFNLSLSWGISSLSSEDVSLTKCHSDALEMLEDTPIAERKARFDIPKLSSISLDEEKKLLSAIQTLDYDSIDRCLDAIFAERIHIGLSVQLLAGELMSIANRLCSELNIDLSGADESIFQTASFEDDADPALILEWSKNLFHNIIRIHMEHTRPSRHSTYARFVRTFIADNYKEDISLKAIAETMGITEQHLSKIFKDETGEKLSSYLSRFRIDKAKELLENDVNIKYLYSEVGFKNYNYFFVAFKKSVGCTPVEYKKSHVRKKDM